MPLVQDLEHRQAVQSSQETALQLLVRLYSGRFSAHRRQLLAAARAARTEPLIGRNKIDRLGDHTRLAGYTSLVHQMLQALQDLQDDFIADDAFQPGLQLLRLIAAPGMGKVTLLTRNTPATLFPQSTPALRRDSA